MANVNVRRHLSEAEIWRAVGMVEQGATHRQVGDVFDVHHSVINRAWSRFQRYGTPVRRHGGVRERATSAAQDRFLVIQASQLRTDLQNASGVNISTQTIRSRLLEGSLRSRRPCIRIPLTRNHHRVWYEWAMDHVRWTRGDWRPVFFTDESRYCLESTDRRARVWRRRGYMQYCWAWPLWGGGGGGEGRGAQWWFRAESVGMGVLTSVSYTMAHWPHNGVGMTSRMST